MVRDRASGVSQKKATNTDQNSKASLKPVTKTVNHLVTTAILHPTPPVDYSV